MTPRFSAPESVGPTLAELGWRAFFRQQVDAQEADQTIPVRVVAVHRNGLQVRGTDCDKIIQHYCPDNNDDKATVGDWLLLDLDQDRALRRLNRLSLLKRKIAGTSRAVQLIAANVDTLMIVSSCNKDFNIARLERYLALAREAEVTPIVVLTKADLTEESEVYRQDALALLPNLCVETLDATDSNDIKVLLPWCKSGQTIAFVGSSGVGKSTLTNTLMGAIENATRPIREDDAKGRHTTSHRALFRLPQGGWVIDTPGIRELQLTDVDQGLAEVFSDIEGWASRCRFRDCQHLTEPGCKIRDAIAAGELEENRLLRWRKLIAENERNSMSLADARKRGKAFGRMIKASIAEKKP